ncbi:MAG: ABC transporter permease [Chromatiaceae bacterium]|nr:ABC transporter permease [Chromatiaceae bacterium]
MRPKEQRDSDDRVSIRPAGNGEWIAALSGRWTLDRPAIDAVSLLPAEGHAVERLRLEDAGLGIWDSSLILFLIGLTDQAEARGIAVETGGLPPGVRRLLDLATRTPQRADARREPLRLGSIERIGIGFRAVLGTAGAISTFLGELVLALARLFSGRARFRSSELALFVQQCGAEALPIVTLISVLVGLILAFVGAVQLVAFGAQIYIADAVGIGMLRQMGALMTAVIMAGRTGAAYAAQLGSMQVNEEIDAFKTLGISALDFLVLPRTLALVLMMPLLTLYADVLGILGGVLVGVGVFDIPVTQYLNQTREALSLSHLGVGLFMSLVFAVIIAMAGCYHGLASPRSSAGVGEAATKAVVSAIVGIVVADAIITLVTTELGI